MGVSLRTGALSASRDSLSPWDPLSDSFSSLPEDFVRAKVFRIDRFTTIYHRPTRRRYVRLIGDTYPGVGVVRRELGGEVFVLSETLFSDVLDGRVVYENLRMGHRVDAPSGGEGRFLSAATAGVGEDLGEVILTDVAPVFLDFELRSAVKTEETVDSYEGRFIVVYSANVTVDPGDVFLFNGQQYVVSVPYIDGGFRYARVERIDAGYEPMQYLRRDGTGGYDPTTGLTNLGVTTLAFSGLVGRHVRTADAHYVSRIEAYAYTRHVGFTFDLGNQVVVRGLTYEILKITDRREESQWRLELGR